ncbi:MAG: GNAT family N-acetyltransferase [Polyangiaceae bacterium]|nr:GNAT family N-acetyltransferase [Polyangiaceae bacterium]
MSPTLQIESATLPDLPVVVELLSRQLRDHGITQSTDTLEYALRGILEVPARGHVFVARLDGQIVGLACLSFLWTLEHGGTAVWLDELYVLPEKRGDGVGGALLRSALERARQIGAVAVDLEVDVDHARAERLYEREGFVRHERRRWVKFL